jgi:dTDP-4-amino-4,6-dideoxygalactose transaminase
MARWYTHGDLPPAGNHVLLNGALPIPEFQGYSSCWVNSGTAALALALVIARTHRPDIKAPAVILPAYGCPDLVAAAEFAQVRPVLVDIEADEPGYSMTALAQALTADVVAVVAVNFLGIRERLVEIRNLLTERSRAMLIEDNAQWFPEPAHRPELVGDLVCLSFGRGKPVSLLGGGALLVRSGSGLEVPHSLVGPAQEPGSLFAVKTLAFNALLNRHWYWSINRNPFFSLGQTVFKPLAQVSALDLTRSRILGSNVAAYLRQSRDIEVAWTTALLQATAVTPVCVIEQRKGRLLRYPVLCRDGAMRNALLARLHAAGLGASAMYRCPLANVRGVGNKVQVAGDCKGAEAFAARLLTLPAHPQTRPRDIRNAAAILA